MANQNKNVVNQKPKYNKPKPKGKGKPGKPNPRTSNDKSQTSSQNVENRSNSEVVNGLHMPAKDTVTGNPRWYFINDDVKNQVSQLSFQDIMGMHKVLGEQIPTFMRFYMNPSPGVTKHDEIGENTGANAAFWRFYMQLAAWTGRVNQYQQQDIGITLLAMGNMLSTIEYIRRLFGVSFTYNARNYAFPKFALEAMGLDYSDFSKNRANYRDRFNFLITRTNPLRIPKHVAYFEKCMEIYQNLYSDAPVDMATTMFMLPATAWILNDTVDSHGAILQTVDMCMDYRLNNPGVPAVRTMEYYLNILERQINALQNSEHMTVIYADIMNYANKAGLDLLELDYLSDSYAVAPGYNREFAMQAKHLTVLGAANQFTTTPWAGSGDQEHLIGVTPYNNVYPDPNTGTLVYNPVFHPDVYAQKHNFIISVDTSNPTADDRLEATRYIGVYGVLDNASTPTITRGVYDCDLPDHWCCFAQAIGNEMNVVENMALSTTAESNVTSSLVRAWSKVDCAPFIYLLGTGGTPVGTIGDYQYYTEIPEVWISKLINNVAMGLYTVR